MNETNCKTSAYCICNPELERMVVASLITSYNALTESADILYADCFHDPGMREIYRAVMAIYKRGDAPDMMLVSNELARSGSKLTFLDIADLCAGTTIRSDIGTHALLLRDYSLRRKLWSLGRELTTRAADERYDVESMQSDGMRALQGLFDFDASDLTTLGDSFKDMMQIVMDNQKRQEGETYGTTTGFPEIDRAGGLCGTDLIVVGAETSQGKTSFATSLAMSAIQHGEGVAFYSMEMMPVQLTARISAMRSGVSSTRILRNRLSIDEFNRIGEGMKDVDMSKLYFDGKSNSSLDSILMSIRRMKLKKDIKGAVVDYLQLVRPDNAKQNREQAIGDIARSLKNLAKELNIWIILISQLSRDRQNPRPTLARLRDSGQIEEAADVIYLIYRAKDGQRYPEPFADVPTHGTAMISVAKGRHIGTTQFICGFRPETTSFYPVTPQELAEINAGTSPTSHTDVPTTTDEPTDDPLEF